MLRRARLAAITSVLLLPAAPALAERRMEVHPYLGLDQTVAADLSGGDSDTVAFTTATVGVDASIRNRSTEVQANIAYQHQFSWNRDTPDSDVVTGIASARTAVTRAVSVEGGVFATRLRTDGLSGANGNLAVSGTRSQLYSAYVGPTVQTHVGDVAVAAAYRLGYNRLEESSDANPATGPAVDSFDDSTTHLATVSATVRAGDVLPVGIGVAAGYAREDARQLDQRYENVWGRAEVTVPLTQDLAAVGGIGYETIRASNRDAVRDANGVPVQDDAGRFVTDKNSPRRLSYDNSELIWDVGILWRPSRRTSLALTAGHRYDTMTYTGSFDYQPDARSSINISLYDSVSSFGRSLSGGLANLPDDFIVSRNPFSGDLGGCAFGTDGAACFNSTLAGVRTANFRNRGISGSYVHRSGSLRYGVGLGYSRRKFLGDDPIFAGVNGRTDRAYYAAALLGYTIDDRQSIDANLYANRIDSSIYGVSDVSNLGGYINYHRSFTRRLQGNAAVGIDSVSASGVDTILTALAQIGLRYQF